MKVLVVGGGGREHALCWKFSQEPAVKTVYAAPGNAGTAAIAQNIDIDVLDLDGLVAFANKEDIDLTVVGPEAPLCAGIRNRFDEAGLLLFGPSAAAARLEGSKVFAKEFMTAHKIPTAPYKVCRSAEAVQLFLKTHPEALVVKADGLAAGKGVTVCHDTHEAKAAALAVLQAARARGVDQSVLLEEKLAGEELSVMALCDGERFEIWQGSQDHKAVHEGDLGPNTGGMGAYSPTPLLTDKLAQRIKDEVLQPVIDGMAKANTPYRGLLYAGLMVQGETINVLEFNCRLGDPEAQVLLARLEGNLAERLADAARGALPREPLTWRNASALCVVMAADGYPGAYPKGDPISGLTAAEACDEVVVFHAGTRRHAGHTVTHGGRVLGVTGCGSTLAVARERAYDAVQCITWPGAFFRTDIGWRAL